MRKRAPATVRPITLLKPKREAKTCTAHVPSGPFRGVCPRVTARGRLTHTQTSFSFSICRIILECSISGSPSSHNYLLNSSRPVRAGRRLYSDQQMRRFFFGFFFGVAPPVITARDTVFFPPRRTILPPRLDFCPLPSVEATVSAAASGKRWQTATGKLAKILPSRTQPQHTVSSLCRRRSTTRAFGGRASRRALHLRGSHRRCSL